MVDICAHENKTKFTSLDSAEIATWSTLDMLVDAFRSRKLATEKSLSNGEVELRFQYKSRDVRVSHLIIAFYY